MPALTDVRVVEIEGSGAGAYCAKLFADCGADVSVIGRGNLTSAQRVFLHHGKRRQDRPSGSIEADVVIESSEEGPLPPARDLPVAADTVRVRLSPYGPVGPSHRWQSCDLTAYGHSGHLYLTGEPDREPLSPPPGTPALATGLFGFVAAMSGLIERARTQRVSTAEVATHEVLVALHQQLLMRYQYGGDVLCRMGNRYTGQGQPNALYEASDGWVAISAPTEAQVEMVCAVTGGDHLFEHPAIGSAMDFQTHPAVLDDHLVPWIRQRTMHEVTDLFQSVRIPAAPATPMSGVLRDEHLAHRNAWTRADDIDGDAGGRPIRIPARPFRFSGATGIGDSVASGGSCEPAAPLAGVRVLDLCRVWAGPLAARILAELGAEVIQVEAPWGRGPRLVPDSVVEATRLYPDDDQGLNQWNRNGHLIKYGVHKKSVVLDLTHEAGAAAFERLATSADVVIENYSTRVMPQLGLDEHRLHEVNPSLVYMTMPGYGRSGPAEQWVAYGTTVDSHAGLSHLIGYEGRVPWKNGVAWPDPVAGLHAAAAILVGLWCRDVTGGVTIEGAQFEATLTLCGVALADTQLRGEDPPVLGNRSAQRAPQGVYRCAGRDSWVALSVPDDAAWRCLAEELGLGAEAAALNLAARIKAHEELDEHLGAWTSALDPLDAAEALQALGVAAAPVLDAPGVLADRQLEATAALFDIDQPDAAPFRNSRLPIHFSVLTERPPLRPAALLGENNNEVLRLIAGLSQAELDQLIDLGVVATEPPE